MIKQPVSAGFGFIVPEEELEAHLEDKEGTVYFRQMGDIDCETMPKLNPKLLLYEGYIYPVYPAWQDMREAIEDRGSRTSVSGESRRSGGGHLVTKKALFRKTAACGVSGSGGYAFMRGLPRSLKLSPLWTTGIMR